MTKKKLRDSSEQEREFGILLEDMNDKIQVVLEVTAPIPKIQEDLADIKGRTESMELRLDTWKSSIKLIPEMHQQIEHMMSWESDVKLIPAIFEEVGNLRAEIESIKAGMKLLDRRDSSLDQLEKRLERVEKKIRA